MLPQAREKLHYESSLLTMTADPILRSAVNRALRLIRL
jgi:hypothetical protein